MQTCVGPNVSSFVVHLPYLNLKKKIKSYLFIGAFKPKFLGYTTDFLLTIDLVKAVSCKQL